MTKEIKGFGVSKSDDTVRSVIAKLGHTNQTFGTFQHEILGRFAENRVFQTMLLQQSVDWRKKTRLRVRRKHELKSFLS